MTAGATIFRGVGFQPAARASGERPAAGEPAVTGWETCPTSFEKVGQPGRGTSAPACNRPGPASRNNRESTANALGIAARPATDVRAVDDLQDSSGSHFMNAAIAIAGVTKRFGNVVAVDDLDLRCPRGSLYGFIGPNGSGKTTTLRMIMHILLPDQGEIEVLGDARHPRGARPRQLPARGARAVQADERAAAAPLLRLAQGGTPARARPVDRRLARADGPLGLDRQEGRRPVEGHGAEGPVHRHGAQPARAGDPRRAVLGPRPGQRRGPQGRGARPQARRGPRSSSRPTTWRSPSGCATGSS